VLDIAKAVKAAGARLLRGGAFKPRTSPYAFQGLGEEGLQYLAEAKKITGLPVITEIVDPRDIELVAQYADVLQIGARNMQNFRLLTEVGKYQKPVLLKRGLSATIKEFLLSAEYIMAGGNHRVILCERGIRTFETQTRNTLDLAAVPLIQSLSHLPVVVDPSHATGRWDLVAPMALAAVAAGADGLLIEVHDNPEEALSDGESLKPAKFAAMMTEMRKVAQAVAGRSDISAALFRRLAVVGVGLIGGSVAWGPSAAAGGPGPRRRSGSASLRHALVARMIDAVADAADAVRDADLVVLAVPVGALAGLADELAPRLDPLTVVTDVGSVKRSVVERVGWVIPRFVGGHPMAGSEQSPPRRRPICSRATCLVTPTERTDRRRSRRWNGCGTRSGDGRAAGRGGPREIVAASAICRTSPPTPWSTRWRAPIKRPALSFAAGIS
jgi:3-deoxy-7-phosphoheptulonate synthase